MFIRKIILGIGALILGAATAGTAMAGPRERARVEVGKVGIEIRADHRGLEVEFRGGRRHRDDGYGRGRGRGRGRHHDDRAGHRHGHQCQFVPGHYESRTQKVWIPGYTRTEYVPPIYETRYGRHGRSYRVLVREGYTRCIEVPGRWEYRSERVWVPGRYLCGC